MTDTQSDIVTILSIVGIALLFAALAEYLAEKYFGKDKNGKEYYKKYVYIHPECGKPAFFLTERPKYGERTDSKKATHLDGSPIKHGELMKCGSCGEIFIGMPMTKNIVEWKDEK